MQRWLKPYKVSDILSIVIPPDSTPMEQTVLHRRLAGARRTAAWRRTQETGGNAQERRALLRWWRLPARATIDLVLFYWDLANTLWGEGEFLEDGRIPRLATHRLRLLLFALLRLRQLHEQLNMYEQLAQQVGDYTFHMRLSYALDALARRHAISEWRNVEPVPVDLWRARLPWGPSRHAPYTPRGYRRQNLRIMLSAQSYNNPSYSSYLSRHRWNAYDSVLPPIPENRPILHLAPLLQIPEEPLPMEHGHFSYEALADSQQASPLCYMVVSAWPMIGSDFFSSG